jgi:hypothetical protein
VGAHQSYGLKRIMNRVGLDIIPVAAKPVPQNHRIDAVAIEVRHKIRALGSHVERVVPATCRQDHGRAGVDPPVDGVHLDGRIMDIDDAVDPARHRLAQVVLLGLMHPLLLEQRRIRRIERHDHPALNNRLRRVGSIIGGPRLWHAQSGRNCRQ